jgi:hypothetical protein
MFATDPFRTAAKCAKILDTIGKQGTSNLSAQNIVATFILVAVAVGVYVAIERYEPPLAMIEHLEMDAENLELLLKVHGNCPNGCASYPIHIRGNGDLHFVVEEFTRVVGGVDGQISAGQMFLIAAGIQRSRFLEWHDTQDCDAQMTHQPWVLFWVRWQYRERKEERSLGCINEQSDALQEVLATVNGVVNIDQWIEAEHRSSVSTSIIR